MEREREREREKSPEARIDTGFHRKYTDRTNVNEKERRVPPVCALLNAPHPPPAKVLRGAPVVAVAVLAAATFSPARTSLPLPFSRRFQKKEKRKKDDENLNAFDSIP